MPGRPPTTTTTLAPLADCQYAWMVGVCLPIPPMGSHMGPFLSVVPVYLTPCSAVTPARGHLSCLPPVLKLSILQGSALGLPPPRSPPKPCSPCSPHTPGHMRSSVASPYLAWGRRHCSLALDLVHPVRCAWERDSWRFPPDILQPWRNRQPI